MSSGSESALWNEDVNVLLWDFCFHDVPVFFKAVVSCVKDSNSIDFDDEHGGTDDMPCDIGCDFDSILFCLHSEFDGIDAFQTV